MGPNATSPSVAKYAKKGCNDTCGNKVTIPFPFGIGADCAVNEWYIVECNNSTPYLPAVLNRPEVLGVNLIHQTVIVSTPNLSGCQNPSGNNISEFMGVNLGASPFLFSKYNRFVFEGCGTVALMMDNGSVVTGCSTTCVKNATFSSDRNNCFGNGCCKTEAISHHLKSYHINMISLEGDGVCGSAFLVDETSNTFSEPYISNNDPFTPVLLLWTLTNSDQITCCDGHAPDRRKVDVFNGIPLDTLKCDLQERMSLLVDNPYLKDGCKHYGCPDKCKNPRIHLKVLGVDLEYQTVTVGTPRITDCKNPVRNSSEIMGVELDGSPFFFSNTHNKFVFKGCGDAVLMMDNGSVLTACSTACCGGVTHDDRNKCIGMGDCCETKIPYHFQSYSINLLIGSLEEEDGGCGSGFLVDETSYHQGTWFSVNSSTSTFNIPVSFRLTLDQVTCCDKYDFTNMVDMFNGTTIFPPACYTSDFVEGNPYLNYGCKEVPYGGNSEDEHQDECGKCIDRGGYCAYLDTIFFVDGSVFSQNIICQHGKRPPALGVILGVSISMGVLFLIAFCYLLYKWIKKTKENRPRKRFFKRNGGLLLKQQEEADPSLVDKTIHFKSYELQKATDNFNENRILGQEGQETEVSVLVSEFIPNGTLYDMLHNETNEFPISLDMRLQIATEVAGALAYLHSATSIPIYHRDIKTTNILLDEKYRAKVSDFGTSRFVSIEQTHLTTLVKGTFGYLDPEYFQSSQFTEKSDVYSFGVVLLELLTGERPISLTRFGENRSLATHFMLAMEEGRVMSIFDEVVIKEGTRDELLILANLATRCLNLSGKYRPTIKEVAIELETIRRSHIPSMVQKLHA
ncbi:hypothetical protein R6Q59_007750 [Mikania micrantha]